MILLTLIWYVVVNKQQLSQNVSSTMKHVIRTFNAAQIGIAGMFAFSFHACCFCCDPATSNKRFFAMSALSVENKCWRLRWLGVNISLESLCTHPGALVVIPMNDCAHIHSFIHSVWFDLIFEVFDICILYKEPRPAFKNCLVHTSRANSGSELELSGLYTDCFNFMREDKLYEVREWHIWVGITGSQSSVWGVKVWVSVQFFIQTDPGSIRFGTLCPSFSQMDPLSEIIWWECICFSLLFHYFLLTRPPCPPPEYMSCHIQPSCGYHAVLQTNSLASDR